MARHLLLNSLGAGTTTTGLGMASFLICAIALMMCASHGRCQWRRFLCARHWAASEPVIIIHQVQPGGDGDVCLWQRGILMGEKCQLPDYSGVITYDSAGKLIPSAGPGAVMGALL